MYNDDFKSFNLNDESNVDLKAQLKSKISDVFKDFTIRECYINKKKKNKIYYCGLDFGYDDDKCPFYVKVDLNNGSHTILANNDFLLKKKEYNKNDFVVIDLKKRVFLKKSLINFYFEYLWKCRFSCVEKIDIYKCCVNKNENKIYYCYCIAARGDKFFIKIDLNGYLLTFIDDDKLEDIIFHCNNK